MEKYGFVYIWYDRKHKRYYIGCRWGTEDDGYICSSKWMKDSYKRRPQDFKRRTISKVYTTRHDLFEEEYRWLQMIPNEHLGKKYYNFRNTRFGYWMDRPNAANIISKISNTNLGRVHTEDAKKRMSIAQKGRTVTDEHRKKISTTLSGRKLDVAHKEKISSTLKGTPKSKEHRTNISIGKKGSVCSLETREKISNSLKGTTFPNRKSPPPFSEEHRRKMSQSHKERLPIKQCQHHFVSTDT